MAVGRNMGVNSVPVSAQKEVKRTVAKAFVILENTCIHEQNVAREMNNKIASGEALEGNDEYVWEHWKKGDLCQKVAETWLNGVLLLGGNYNL